MVNKSIGLKVLIFPLSLVFSVMITILFIKPAYSDLLVNKNALKVNGAELLKLQEQTGKLENMRKEMLSVEKKDLVSVALPEKENAEDYLNELYQRAARSGILLNDFSVQQNASSVQSSFACGSAGISQLASASGASSGTAGTPTTSENSSNVDSANSLVAMPLCAQASKVEISIKGNWDQIMSFYKFLSDSNRIANISQVSMAGDETQGESASDLMSVKIGIEIFHKPKIASNFESVNVLVGQSGLKTSVIKKMAEEIIYSPYSAPSVSETEARNIFK